MAQDAVSYELDALPAEQQTHQFSSLLAKAMGQEPRVRSGADPGQFGTAWRRVPQLKVKAAIPGIARSVFVNKERDAPVRRIGCKHARLAQEPRRILEEAITC